MESLKIGALVQESGVSRELIHHYLREGLLPRPSARARYGARHLQLLRLIKRLRDERFLPLPVIRELLASHDYDPERVELVLLSGAAPARTTLGEQMSLDELCARAGVPREVAQGYVAAGLIKPLGQNGAARYGQHDANVVALIRRGIALGIPLDSFRTIRSYVELGFELERATFVPPGLGPDLAGAAREVAVRNEIATGFVMNVLGGLIEGTLHRFLAETAREARALGVAAYRPSEAFLAKHGIPREIDVLRARLGAAPRDRETILALLRLFFLAGRWHEAAFTAEQALAVVGDSAEAQRLRGFSAVLLGDVAGGVEVLARAHAAHPRDPVTAAWLAAARFHEGGAADAEALLRATQQALDLADAALASLDGAPAADAAEARLVCGWLLSGVPLECDRYERGLRELEAVYRAASPAARPSLGPAPVRLRLRLASAVLLVAALARPDVPVRDVAAPRRRAALRDEVLRLDPQSDAAAKLYLEPDEPEERGTR